MNITGSFHKEAVIGSFDGNFMDNQNKLMNKQSNRPWFETR